MLTSFIEVQRKWYAALAQEGFVDIEDVRDPERPLLKWTGVCYNHLAESDRVVHSVWPEGPLVMLEELFYHPKMPMVCERICKHGNHSMSPQVVRKILEMHIEGKTCRDIGRVLEISYVTVFRAQKKLKEWALLIENRDE